MQMLNRIKLMIQFHDYDELEFNTTDFTRRILAHLKIVIVTES